MFTPTGPCAVEESSPCDLISSSITNEAEPKMLSHDPNKETQPCCSLTNECTESPLLVNPEREGKSVMILARAAQKMYRHCDMYMCDNEAAKYSLNSNYLLSANLYCSLGFLHLYFQENT